MNFRMSRSFGVSTAYTTIAESTRAVHSLIGACSKYQVKPGRSPPDPPPAATGSHTFKAGPLSSILTAYCFIQPTQAKVAPALKGDLVLDFKAKIIIVVNAVP
uniref:Uncharacterized protein n=1 Tax=Ceratitis capitata TaxID=7213 RepID=W8BPP8_CERCA